MPRFRARRSRPRRRVMRKRVYRKRKFVTQTHLIRRQGALIRITQTGNAGTPATAITLPASGNGSCAISAVGSDNMANTVQFGNSYVFKLSSVIDYTDMTALFDRYKIVGVKLKIMYQASEATPGGAGVLPIFNYAWDYDDSNVPSGLTVVNTKASARSLVLSANRPVSVFIKCKVPTTINNPANIDSGFAVARPMWINAAYPDCSHFGFKTWVNNFYAPTGANNQITVQPTYYLALKDPQ